MNLPQRRTGAKEELARRRHLDFIKYCWNKSTPFIIGKHTKAICQEIDNAIKNYREGIPSYIIITVPFRHGKSDIVSRYLPPHFMGMFPEDEVMCASYSAELAHDLSRSARGIFKSRQFQTLYPDARLNPDSSSVGRWEHENGLGSSSYLGVYGGGTGRGYSLGIVDDYCKNREEAESPVIREKTWDWFTNVFMTRRAPVSITLIVATPWHVDDIIGRCKKEMVNDPEFPRFKLIKFQALDDDGNYLFPERFSHEWYHSMTKLLGTYGTASLLQCEPQQRGGNMLKVDRIKVVDQAPEDIRWCRAWDLASTEKELIKNDPDWTVGALIGIKYEFDLVTRENIPKVYLKDIVRMREEAPARNRRIQQVSDIDGQEVLIAVECVAGYKDTYTTLESVFSGRRSILPMIPSKDKIVRASWLDPVIEAGNFHIVRGDWNNTFLEEMGSFPSGAHDDQVDAVMTGIEAMKNNSMPDLGKIESCTRIDNDN